jgi:S-DNA-T family DNA segregation ATPase FtsK/SpoIIIE
MLLGGSTWKAAHRESFDATIGLWIRTWTRKWVTYRRRWHEVMTRCGLSVEVGDEVHVPRLRHVSTTPYWDRLELDMQVGQELADFEGPQHKLRNAFGAERISVRELAPSYVGIDLMRRDPFRHEVVPATVMPAETADIDWSAVPVGITEQLERFTVSVVGGHTAVAGMPGAGKASVEWNVLRYLAPAIADGTVRPVFVDPKARELRQGISLVDAGVFGTTKDEGPKPTGDYAVTAYDTLCLFERIVAELETVNAAGGDTGERDFVPSTRTPLRPIFIDELAPLLAYWPRTLRDKLESLLGIVLTQGRAAGYIVIGCIQEPTKDVFKVRDLFARRIGMRLPTEAHTDAILTDKAIERGADCNRIAESLPGVCFAFHERDTKAIRARFGHVTDADIRELVEYVEALRKVTSIAPAPALELVVDDGTGHSEAA